MKPIIQVSGIGKCYTINHKDRASYKTIKDDFSNFISSPFHRQESTEEQFWALKNVSFEVNQGEIFGVIGRNGSGKSTLLKILSRIVEPTHGEVKMHGRVASLLEVGTGFHPELTGRENVFFNGSMLGMNRKEISNKFNEIVSFAEVEKFIDTPVKFYSSGMYVRLAFSVAAHLDPDILILDEVLSVGDVAFQKKSLQKITEKMESGCTVLFVSHSMASVQQLCSRGLMLNDGKIEAIGSSDEVTDRYKNMMAEEEVKENIKAEWIDKNYEENEYVKPIKMYLKDDYGKIIKSHSPNNLNKWVCIDIDVKKESDLLNIGFAIYNSNKSLLFMSYPKDCNEKFNFKKGAQTIRASIPEHLLNEGKYKIILIGGIHNKQWIYEPGANDNPSIELIVSGGLSESSYWKNAREGYLAPILKWEVN